MHPRKTAEIAEVIPLTNGAVLGKAVPTVVEQSLTIRSKPINKLPAPPALVELPDTDDSDTKGGHNLQTWKKALSLDEGLCGATAKYFERCMNKAAASKPTDIEKLINFLRRPNKSSEQV